jgi:3-hydroxyisobutyrate dehydrogenase
MKVGFIGLGTMGGAMALNLREAGFDLLVYDMRPEMAEPQIAAGAASADSVTALGKAVDVALTSLPGPREVEAVGAELMASLLDCLEGEPYDRRFGFGSKN